jgi:hypothetical protein
MHFKIAARISVKFALKIKACAMLYQSRTKNVISCVIKMYQFPGCAANVVQILYRI